MPAIATAGVNHWTSGGPYGGSASSLAVDPTDPRIVYAAFPGHGVFKTVDGGSSWLEAGSGITDLYVSALAIATAAPTILYATGAAGRVFRSVDRATTWSEVSKPAGSVSTVAVDPVDTNVIYTGAIQAVFKSTNGGLTWQNLSQGLAATGISFQIAIDPQSRNVLYACAASLFKTTDGGLTWQPTAGGLGSATPLRFAIDPAVTSTLFAGTDQGLFRSRDGGVTWSHVLGSGTIRAVAAVAPSVVYASDDTGAFKSADGGDHWSPTPVAPAPAVFASSAASVSMVYASTVVGLSKTEDGGASWASANSGIHALDVLLRVNPVAPEWLYAWSSNGLVHSHDGGSSWSADASFPPVGDLPPGRIAAIAFEPNSSSNAYLSDAAGTTFRTMDQGQSWQDLGRPSSCCISGSSVLAISDAMPSTLYLGTGGRELPAQLFRSSDSGSSWEKIYDPGFAGFITFLRAAPSAPSLYAGVQGLAFSAWIKSRDGGSSWAELGTPPNASPFPTPFPGSVDAVDPVDPSVLYARSTDALFRSVDGGDLWARIDAELSTFALGNVYGAERLVVDPRKISTLYAATDVGVYRTTDAGAHWAKFSDGLPAGPATSLTIDATGRFLHVAAGGGVYDYTVAEPCLPTPGTLCFLGGRFLATVAAVDPRTGRLEHGSALSRGDRFGYFSLPGFTGDANFPEIVVKMVDARAITGQGFWVFHSGLTDLQYTLSVLDTATGRQKTYRNDRADPSELCGGADTATFGPDSETGSANRPALEARRSTRVKEASLMLLDRFQATLTATDPRTGEVSEGVAVPQDAKWGYFSLPAFTGDPAFPEVFVKMVDATSLPGGFFWVFHTGLTDLEYTLRVTDTRTGAAKIYRNDRSDPARLCGGADTAAFRN